MIVRGIVAAALGAVVSATGALADPAPVEPAPSCDFFQAELIGVLCGHTAYVAPGVQGSEETRNWTTISAPAGGFHGGGFHGGGGGGGGGTTVQHWDDRNIYESMTVAVSPWQGVRFHVTGEAFQYDDSYSSLFTGGGGGGFHGGGGWHGGGGGWHIGPAPAAQSGYGSYGGWQGFGAEATLWDTQMQTPFGAMHYVF